MKTSSLSVIVDVTGRVQGVGYRYYVQNIAVQFGIKGWVRNMEDGSVKAFLYGSPENVHSIISYMKKGPGSAFIEKLVWRESAADENIKTFTIR